MPLHVKYILQTDQCNEPLHTELKTLKRHKTAIEAKAKEVVFHLINFIKLYARYSDEIIDEITVFLRKLKTKANVTTFSFSDGGYIKYEEGGGGNQGRGGGSYKFFKKNS